MKDKNINKLNDRKRKLYNEYKSGENYFQETSFENIVEPKYLCNNSLYQNFINLENNSYIDESIEKENSPKE